MTQDNIRKEWEGRLGLILEASVEKKDRKQGERKSQRVGRLTRSLKAFIQKALDSAIREERERIEKNIGALRQWLNEDRITDPSNSKMVTNEELLSWLIPQREQETN